MKANDCRIRPICAVLALWKVHADVNYRWCLAGDTKRHQGVTRQRALVVPLAAERGLSHVSAAHRTCSSEKSYCPSFRWGGGLADEFEARIRQRLDLVAEQVRCAAIDAPGFGQPNVKFLSQEAQRPLTLERRHAGLNTRLALGAACSNSA
jgi:hypothetical protein